MLSLRKTSGGGGWRPAASGQWPGFSIPACPFPLDRSFTAGLVGSLRGAHSMLQLTLFHSSSACNHAGRGEVLRHGRKQSVSVENRLRDIEKRVPTYTDAQHACTGMSMHIHPWVSTRRHCAPFRDRNRLCSEGGWTQSKAQGSVQRMDAEQSPGQCVVPQHRFPVPASHLNPGHALNLLKSHGTDIWWHPPLPWL